MVRGLGMPCFSKILRVCARVFAGKRTHLAENADRAQRDVLQVADRRGDGVPALPRSQLL